MTDRVDPLADIRSDELLLIRCQLGERAAFDQLIGRWNGSLWIYVRRMTGRDDLAQEVLQESWLRVLRGIHRLNDAAKFRAWLFGIARRVLFDHWRQKYAAPAGADMDLMDVPADESAEDLFDDIVTMECELALLPDAEREVLTLFYLRELSLAEVAEVLAVPQGTVKSRLFRARRMLRQELEAKG